MVISLALIDRVKDAAVVLGMAGALLVTSASPQIRAAGFSCWIVANALWVMIGIMTENVYLFVLFGAYFILAATGLRVAGDN